MGAVLSCTIASAADLESLHRETVFAGPNDGTRSYQRTALADYARSNFMAEVTVTLKGGGGAGCAFFGLGRGEANPQSYNEPATKPVVFVRLAPDDFAGGQVVANVNGEEAGQGSAVGDGTHRVRLIWDAAGKRAMFDVDGKSSVTASAGSIKFGDSGHLFVGGANGVRFADFSVKALSDAEIQKAGFGESFGNDPTAGTWLSASNTTGMRLLACWYHGSKLAATRVFTNGDLQTTSSRWGCEVREQPVPGEPGTRDLTATFKLAEGMAKSAGVAVAFDFADWSTNNYVLIPASIYNGNRNRIEHRAYATGLNRDDLYKKELPLTTTELPQLSPEPGKPSKVEVTTCNATTPAVCVYNRQTKRAFMVLAEQQTRFGDNGLMIEESPDRSRATVVISAPGVRERKPEFIGFGASPDRGVDWKPGDAVTMRLRVYEFEAPDIPGLLERFMGARKAVTGTNHPRNLIPFSEVTRLMAKRIDSRFYDGKEFKFYCPENANWISFGWVGGLMDTFPMLALGDDFHLDRVTKTFDFAIPRAQGKAGYFYGALNYDGKCFGREGYDEHPEICLTRKNGDVLFWMMKQFQVLKAQGRGTAIKPAWEQSVKRLADAFVATWKKDGQWGNFVNIDTGEVAVYNTTGGAMAIGGLALASEYFHEPQYLETAKEAADFYYRRDFLAQGQTTGACADILQNADSETAAGFMTALMALYDTTGDKAWLEKSRNLANLAATWTVSYDYELPANTELAQLGAKLAGVYWASTQNKHGAPGICCSSGDPLFKIYRATGDRRYADLMRDIAHAHAEGIKPDGRITERLTYCDADSRGSRGGGSTGWNELNGFLMALELPGIYLRTDKNELYVFDHVEAAIVKRDAAGLTLAITNPTRHDAKVSISAENARRASQPLGYTAFLKWPKVEVKAGATTQISITPSGQLQP